MYGRNNPSLEAEAPNSPPECKCSGWAPIQRPGLIPHHTAPPQPIDQTDTYLHHRACILSKQHIPLSIHVSSPRVQTSKGGEQWPGLVSIHGARRNIYLETCCAAGGVHYGLRASCVHALVYQCCKIQCEDEPRGPAAATA
ncbi:hypothetical protein B0T26DRAFT_111413 [Lasiosphaeria miniovina]|uniref:Uncharacterized protein n=1 Tax=Lasiosphaeria miniovina TaxID=1954250 RepID=A0AA40E4P4_9PEZI|nr:uncharacterized protein B0T26DRAFT_111413 [Lasiosphaeria miniovina]KAK0726995.1 hypothetical protein B0T26DRAFT_111413 [Lasiosphaeria miniovina]